MDRPAPLITPTARPYWEGLDRGEVHIQRCRRCERYVFYPRVRCPGCLSNELEWVQVAGTGHLVTFAAAWKPTMPAFADGPTQLIGVVELDEGVRLTTTVVDAEPGDLRIGLPLAPVFDRGDDGITLLRHRPR